MSLKPLKRLEMILDGQDIEPATRIEAILEGQDIQPATRFEYFIKKAMSGGGAGSQTASVTINYTDNPQACDLVVPAFIDNDELACGFNWQSDNFYQFRNFGPFDIILYNGKSFVYVLCETSQINITISGNGVLSEKEYVGYVITVSGDVTINISNKQEQVTQ